MSRHDPTGRARTSHNKFVNVRLVCFAEPVLDNCCCLEVMALERRVLVLPIEDVRRKLLECAVAHGIIEHMIANGRFLFVTMVHEARVPVGRMRLPETVFTD